MALNPSIILSGQQVQPVNALMQGAQAGQQMNDIKHANDMRDMYQQHGAGIAAGDQNALNALAAFDPQAALGVQGTRLGMDQTRQNMAATQQRMAMLSREEQRAIDAQASQMTAQQRAAEAQQIEQAVASGLQAQTPQQWDQMVSSVAPDLVGQFENREMIAARYMSIADSLQRFDERNVAAEPAAPMSPLGKFYADQAAGLIPADAQPPQTGTNVNVTNNTGGTDAFYDAADKSAAQTMTTLAEQGSSAGANLARLDALEGTLQNIPTGAQASLQSWAGSLGLQTEGLSDIQAAEAIINQMVPGQRPPGSGTMSDRDLELFKLSLPRLINTPEGNEKIITTMRAISQYQLQESEIATKVLNREISPAEGRQALQSLANPLASEPVSTEPVVIDGYTITVVE